MYMAAQLTAVEAKTYRPFEGLQAVNLYQSDHKMWQGVLWATYHVWEPAECLSATSTLGPPQQMTGLCTW
jgi:hypothetical protein